MKWREAAGETLMQEGRASNPALSHASPTGPVRPLAFANRPRAHVSAVALTDARVSVVNPRDRFDVCVVGAGIVGSSIAMALAERNLKTIAVDLDLSGRLSSSEKNAGGVRATWWQPVNIILCRATIQFYEKIATQVGFRQKGYLWLYDDATWPQALAHVELQRSLGHPIEILSASEVSGRFPEIDKLDGIAGATFSPRDGLINPNLLKEYYRGA